MTSKDNLSFPLSVLTCIFPPLAHRFDVSALGKDQGVVRHEVLCVCVRDALDIEDWNHVSANY